MGDVKNGDMTNDPCDSCFVMLQGVETWLAQSRVHGDEVNLRELHGQASARLTASDRVTRRSVMRYLWVCLKIGYIPNEIAI